MRKLLPRQPDPYIKKATDQEIAKFGHLNAIINELNSIVEDLDAIEAQILPSPLVWKSVDVSYTDFSTAGLTKTINIYAPLASDIIHSCIILPTEVFTGGAIATYTISVGLYTAIDVQSARSVFTIPAKGWLATAPQIAESSNPSHVTATAVSTVGNLNAATNGKAKILLLVSSPI